MLEAGVAIPWPPSPHDYIPFDTNSTDQEIAAAIASSIEAQALSRRKSFRTIDICRDAIRYWDVLHPPHRIALAKRIERVVEELVTHGYAGQFQIKSKKQVFAVEVTPSAMRAASSDRNAYARRLIGMTEKALEQLEKRTREQAASGQNFLFPGVTPPDQPPRRGRRKR